MGDVCVTAAEAVWRNGLCLIPVMPPRVEKQLLCSVKGLELCQNLLHELIAMVTGTCGADRAYNSSDPMCINLHIFKAGTQS